jgi:restriction endonuclease S subunit
MACNVSNGIILDCRDNVGGLKNLWITDFDNITSITKTSTGDTADTITSISGTGTFYEFQLIRQTSSYTSTINASLEAGTVFYGDELVAYFNKMEQEKRNIVKTLAQSQRLALVFEDNNGDYFLMGESYGAFITAGTIVSGLAMGDANGYNLTFGALEPYPANQLSGPLSSVATGINVQ